MLTKLSDTQVELKTALEQLRLLKENIDILTKEDLKKDILIKNYAIQTTTGKLQSPDQSTLHHQVNDTHSGLLGSWFGAGHTAPSSIDPKGSDGGLMNALQKAMLKNINDRDSIKSLGEDVERLIGENKALKNMITQLTQNPSAAPSK